MKVVLLGYSVWYIRITALKLKLEPSFSVRKQNKGMVLVVRIRDGLN